MDLNTIIETKIAEIRENTTIFSFSDTAEVKEEDYLWLLSTVEQQNDLVQELAKRIIEIPTELKHKNNIPTVIEYKGKRYVYDPNN